MSGHDSERFERAVLPHLDDAYTLARYLVRDEHSAQDVVQDAVLRALRYFDSYAGDDTRVWLLAVVRNCAMDWHRRHRFDKHTVDIDAEDALLAGDARSSDAAAIDASERQWILRALADLPAEFREVIVLREINGLSYKEIGEVTGVPTGTVMSRLARARKRLASALSTSTRQAG
jgi:RNA polymerase sigma-70 factor, ECF subfamily